MKAPNELKNTSEQNFLWWIVGIIILTLALLLSAGMGLYQEIIAKQFGKNPDEALYYTVNFTNFAFIYY